MIRIENRFQLKQVRGKYQAETKQERVMLICTAARALSRQAVSAKL